MSDMSYEQALEAALYPLRDHIWVVGESKNLKHKALGAFFSEQDAHDFVENQISLHPDKFFYQEGSFGSMIRRLQESRNESMEKLKELSEELEEKK